MNAHRIAIFFGLVLVAFSSNQLLAQESKSSCGGHSDLRQLRIPIRARVRSLAGHLPSPVRRPGSATFWSRSKPKKQSTMSRMGYTTRKWMYNTADFLNPFNDGKPKATQSHGYQTDYWSNRNKPRGRKEQSLRWMWKGKKKQKISSVNDFLSQEMPY